jgi:hypothetical protein
MLLTLAAAMVLGTAAQAQYQAPYQAPPPPSRYEQRELRIYDRGYREGYWAGRENRGGSGAPGFMTDRMGRDERNDFRRGYKDGFHRGKDDRRHGAPWLYPRP